MACATSFLSTALCLASADKGAIATMFERLADLLDLQRQVKPRPVQS